MPEVVKKLSISSELALKMVNAAVAKAKSLALPRTKRFSMIAATSRLLPGWTGRRSQPSKWRRTKRTQLCSAGHLVVEGTSRGRMSGRGQAAKLLAGASATSLSFEMVAYRACTSISIPIIRVRMRRDFDGVGTVSGESDDHPSGDDSWAG